MDGASDAESRTRQAGENESDHLESDVVDAEEGTGTPNGTEKLQPHAGESDSSSGLEDDDRELIRENLARRGTGLRHLQSRAAAIVSSEDESDEDDAPKRPRAAPEELARLFADDAPEQPSQRQTTGQMTYSAAAERALLESESDADMADFIEDERGEAPAPRRRGERAALAAAFGGRVPARALDDLAAVFGDGADYAGMVAEDDDESESGHALPDAEGASSGDATPPAEAARDLPERYADGPALLAADEVPDAAAYVCERTGLAPAPVAAVLRLLRVDALEVPVVAAYRKEVYRPAGLGLPDLWAIHDAAREWEALGGRRRAALAALAERGSADGVLGRLARRADAADVLDAVAQWARRADAGADAAAAGFVERLHRVLAGGDAGVDSAHDPRLRRQASTSGVTCASAAADGPLPLGGSQVGDAGLTPGADGHTVVNGGGSQVGDAGLTPIADGHTVANGDSAPSNGESSALPARDDTRLLGSHPVSVAALRALIVRRMALTTAPTPAGTAVLRAAAAPVPGAEGTALTGASPETLALAQSLRDAAFLTDKPADSFSDGAFVRVDELRTRGLLTAQWSVGGPAVESAVASALGGSARDASVLLQRVSEGAVRVVEARLRLDGERQLAAAAQCALQDRLMALPYVPGAHGHAERSATAEHAEVSRRGGKRAAQTRSSLSGFCVASVTPRAWAIVDGDSGALIAAGDAPLASPDELDAALRRERPSVVFVAAPSAAEAASVRARVASLVSAGWASPPALLDAEEDVARLQRDGRAYARAAAIRALDPLGAIASLWPASDAAHGQGDAALVRYVAGLAPWVPRRLLLPAAERALVNVVNLVGVRTADLRAPPESLSGARARAVLRFVAGLGAKSSHRLREAIGQLSSRAQLRELVGPVVFANAAAFFVVANADEPLDGTRVHPGDYALAHRMAGDALGAPAGAAAVAAAAARPAALAELMLDEYAAELVRLGLPDRRAALHDMRAELARPYAERRAPCLPVPPPVLFAQWSGETERSLFVGAVRTAATLPPSGGAYGPPGVALHGVPGAGRVPAEPLVAAVSGALPRRPPGSVVRVRVLAVDAAAGRVVVEALSSSERPAALIGRPGVPSDAFLDRDRYEHSLSAALAATQHRVQGTQPAGAGVPPAIAKHAAFVASCDARRAEEILRAPGRRDGDAVLRLSASRGPGAATLTWRLDDGPVALFQHVPVAFDAAGRAPGLRVAGDVFDDVDEVLARHVAPVHALLREVAAAPKFRALAARTPAEEQAELHALLERERTAHPGRVPYVLCLSRGRPGAVVLALGTGGPPVRARCEIVDVLPTGLRFRGRLFDRIDALVAWFKATSAAASH